jgi:hypothetical protein
MSAAHSGSTILGVALGNCPDFFHAGEVERWLVNSGAPELGGSERAQFWERVRSQVTGAEPLFGYQVARNLERSSSILRFTRIVRRRRLRTDYRRVTGQLFRAIAASAGVSHVVDTSHFPLRARELRGIDGIDLYLVFLFRDPQRVMASELRAISRHDVAERRLRMLATNARLWLTHLLSVLVFLRQPRDRRLLVRHEAFLASPEAVLREILDLADSAAQVPDLSSLETGVPLIGNKIIRSEMVAVRTRAEPPVQRSYVTWLLQLPWRLVTSMLRPQAAGSSHSAKASKSSSP